MTLQVENAFSGNIPKLGRFDRKQAVFTRTKAIESIAARVIAALARSNCGG